jgi:ABC-2 type transport system ATP-binding protein
MLAMHDLTKKYHDFTAVDHVNLEIPEGAVFGFLGHNGAGKTTTLSMLTTLLRPTSGLAEVNGLNVEKEYLKVRELIGYLPENVQLYGDLTVFENLAFFGRLSGIRRPKDAILDMLGTFSLSEWRNARLKTLSKGMRQRVGIVQAMLHHPKVLFLDEPTSGLDPQGTLDIRNTLEAVNAEWGTTIFMNTHLLSEVTRLCTDVGIISHGKLLVSAPLAQLETSYPDCKSLEEIYFVIAGGGTQ